MNAINVLGKAAYAAPLVPSVLVGWAVFEATEGMPLYLRVLAAMAFAVAFEGAGVLAGALRDRRFLVAYIGLGVVTLIALEFFDAAQMVVGICALLVAALVYTVMGERERESQKKQKAALQEEAEAIEKQRQEEAEANERRVSEDRAERERQHKAEQETAIALARIEANKAVRLAKAENQAESNAPKVKRKVSTSNGSTYGKLSHADKLALLDMTGGEIGNMYGITRQAGNGMKRKARAELNGVAK